MNPRTPTNWPEWNQQQLVAALAGVRAAVSPALGGEGTATDPPPPAPSNSNGKLKSALDTLCDASGLSPFERALLLLCAGSELDASFAALIAQRHGDPRRTAPTLALALAALPGAHWSALSPGAPLRRWRFIEIGAGDSLVNSPLRIDERILHFLCGVNALDDRLRGLVQPCVARGTLTPVHAETAARVRRAWNEAPVRTVVQLLGTGPADQRTVAHAACDESSLPLFVMRAADVPTSAPEREAVARLWEREAVLTGAALLLDIHEAEPADLARATAFLNSLGSLALVACREPLHGLEGRSVRLEVPRPAPVESRALWFDALGPERAAAVNGEIEAVAQQFQLDATAINELAATQDFTRAGPRALWQACRLRTRGPIEALAQRIETRAGWDDLVLPPEATRTLRQIAAHVRRRFRVYEEWGFAAKQSRGLGINALFSGPSGTGKTLGAEVIAHELQLDLFRIDLSAVVNKYIGETEKNLRRVFDAAEAAGAILLFDEADSLFGKRSDVRDSHDRYANMEISYLLQRMESYRGLAILTTNMKQSLDHAFLRRLRFVVNFPFPDAAQRAEIWRRAFPATTPTDQLDCAKLARLNVAGGHIRNIAMNAAFLAAETGEPVRMKHLLHAARGECVKLERPPAESEIGGWV